MFRGRSHRPSVVPLIVILSKAKNLSSSLHARSRIRNLDTMHRNHQKAVGHSVIAHARDRTPQVRALRASGKRAPNPCSCTPLWLLFGKNGNHATESARPRPIAGRSKSDGVT